MNLNIRDYQKEFLKHLKDVSVNISKKELARLNLLDKERLILFTGRDMYTTQILLNKFLPNIFLKVISSDQCKKPNIPLGLVKVTNPKIYVGDSKYDLNISQKLNAIFLNINNDSQRKELFIKLSQEKIDESR